MPKTDLQLPGNDYAPVADRIRLFYEAFPSGRIITKLVSRREREIVFRAEVYRGMTDSLPASTGWASEREGDGEVNTVACLENTETSAIGRALANLGFTASRQRPSAEELAKAARVRARVAEAVRGRAAQVTAPAASARSDDVEFTARQEEADAVSDFIDVLRMARRVGLRDRRATILRTRALRGRLAAEAQARIACRLRRWITAGFERAILFEPSPPPPPS